MEILLYSIGATIFISILSLIGVVSLLIKEKILEKTLFILIGFSAGALIGSAFLHLIPEALENCSDDNVFVFVLVGFSAFFVLERFIKWRHCHKHGGECEIHSFVYLNLIGDGLHNFIDGLVITASFSVSINLGLVTTVAVILHEIPQEIGDFGVLVYGGFSKAKALMFNLASALTSVLGAIVGYIIYLKVESFSYVLLAITAGGFIYISSSDLIPELHKEIKTKKALLSFVFFLIGIVFMYITKAMLH